VRFVVPALVLLALIAWLMLFATERYVAAILVGTAGSR
jgi:hypothetical protein